MAETEYGSWGAIAQAIKAAAIRARAEGHTQQTVDAQIAQAMQDRFLSRVFAKEVEGGWLLKGGGAMLARVSQSRSTRDVDLATTAADLDEAQVVLEQAVSVDLGDHLRFLLIATRPTGRGENQPGVQTRRLLFSCVVAETGRKFGEIPVDVVVGPPPVGLVETVTPANRLALPRVLPAPAYRLFPVADQIAEKVCATLQEYNGQPSSRVKDLVDLVVLARTQTVQLQELREALASKLRHLRLPPMDTFRIPEGWERTYRTLAAATPSTGDVIEAGEAESLVRSLVDPALTGHDALIWNAGHGWLPHA